LSSSRLVSLVARSLRSCTNSTVPHSFASRLASHEKSCVNTLSEPWRGQASLRIPTREYFSGIRAKATDV
jgi:hypothetical protein